MAELGDNSLQLHQEIGTYAKANNITHLLTLGSDSIAASSAFSEKQQHFDNKEALKKHMTKRWNTLGTILVKGSRSMRLETLIESLINSEKAA
jgi:UDP-N-acetylmuramyl pentapeptide synthase